MKKVNYLLLILFATVLMNTSCEKEDPITEADEGFISLIELDGQWNFKSYNYKGDEVNFKNLNDYVATYKGIEGIFVNWYFNRTDMSAMRIGDTIGYHYSKERNIIYIWGPNRDKLNGYKFIITNYKDNELELKVMATHINYQYLGGILTLEK